MIEKLNKPISGFLAIFVLFLLVTVLLGNSIQDSIENILLSRAKVHSQTYNLALSPLPEQGSGDNIDRYSLVNTSSAGLRDFVKTADEYGLDWRLAAAISGVESAFGVMPVRVNNAWGWKGGSDGDFNAFDTWAHGIEVVTARLALGYGTQMTPFEIEPIYCPPCGRNPAHLWANGVIKFMSQIDMYLHGF